MPYQPRILAFAGSAREGSFNKLLVRIAATGAEKAGAIVTFIDLRDLPMPLYDADLESAKGIPPNAITFKSLLKESDGFLIASPENNSTISALMKNVIDWASRPVPADPPLAGFDGKVAAVIAASTGELGGIRGLAQLRALLENMRVMVIPDQKAIPKARDAFAADGSLKDSAARVAVEKIGARLAEVLTKLHG